MEQIRHRSRAGSGNDPRMMVQNRFLRGLGLVCVISLSALLVISIGTSNLLTERSPALALAINPFNDEARLNTIIAGLARMEADRDADQRGLTSNREPGSAADGVCDRESPEPG